MKYLIALFLLVSPGFAWVCRARGHWLKFIKTINRVLGLLP